MSDGRSGVAAGPSVPTQQPPAGAPGGTYVHAVERGIENWNLLSSAGNVVETGTVLHLLAPSAFVAFPDLSHRWNRDLLAERPRIVRSDPQTIVYRIRPQACWNDGVPISVADFRYTCAVQDGRTAPRCRPSTHAGYELVESIRGDADGRTVTVQLRPGAAFPDWEAMFSYLYPAHVAGRYGDPTTAAGLGAAFDAFGVNVPSWSGGPYEVASAEPGGDVVLVPNPRWYGNVRPSLERIVLRVMSGVEPLLAALRSGEVDGATPQPSSRLMAGLAELPGVGHSLREGFVWWQIVLNTAVPHLADARLRQALFTAVDRTAILGATLGGYRPGIEPLGSHNFVPGLPAYRDVIAGTGQGTGDVAAARSILSEAGYRDEGGRLVTGAGVPLPALRFRYPAGHQDRRRAAELVREQLRPLGVDVRLEPSDTLGATLAGGDFDAVVFGWTGNPVRVGPARDMWGSGGGMNFGRYSDPEVDRLLAEAAATLDLIRAHDLLNRADVLMTADAYSLPLSQVPTVLAVRDAFVNVRNNPTNGLVVHNAEEWARSADCTDREPQPEI